MVIFIRQFYFFFFSFQFDKYFVDIIINFFYWFVLFEWMFCSSQPILYSQLQASRLRASRALSKFKIQLRVLLSYLGNFCCSQALITAFPLIQMCREFITAKNSSSAKFFNPHSFYKAVLWLVCKFDYFHSVVKLKLERLHQVAPFSVIGFIVSCQFVKGFFFTEWTWMKSGWKHAIVYFSLFNIKMYFPYRL